MIRLFDRGCMVTLFCLGLLACSAEPTSEERRSVQGGGQDGGSNTADGGAIDPSGGRDDAASSCFAACQNTSFSCKTKDGAVTIADLAPDPMGCTGTLKRAAEVIALKLDCVGRKVCAGGPPGQPPTSCVPGTFSAFSFAYTPSGAPPNVCTRD